MPIPEDYFAEWNERPARGARKAAKNLWVYERATGQKRFSVTTEAGAKIQAYFNVPTPTDKYLYFFRVQGEEVSAGKVRIWVTQTTALCLKTVLGSIDGEVITAEVSKLPSNRRVRETISTETKPAIAEPIIISSSAYSRLRLCFGGVSDEHMMQQFAQHLFTTRSS
ncbi:MAG: hypothetical protein NTV33_13425 [Coprothermobacterota bacterium]|nr:hypothetical protein [Coprothermobacterota bacterium]